MEKKRSMQHEKITVLENDQPGPLERLKRARVNITRKIAFDEIGNPVGMASTMIYRDAKRNRMGKDMTGAEVVRKTTQRDYGGTDLPRSPPPRACQG